MPILFSTTTPFLKNSLVSKIKACSFIQKKLRILKTITEKCNNKLMSEIGSASL